MGLRRKLALLLGVFCVFMIGSVLSAAWCIAVYLDSAVSDFRRAEFLTFTLEDIRNEVRAHVLDAKSNCAEREWASALDALPKAGVSAESVQALRGTLAAICREVSPEHTGGGVQWTSLLEKLDGEVRSIRADLSAIRKTEYDRTESVQTLILAILTANIVMGSALIGLVFVGVQRWITRPILRLHEAAERFAAGHLEHRVPVSSGDEIGELSHRVNSMAQALAETQKMLLEQEREAAFGEMARAVAHNLRNPLASIRACAQSSVMHLTKDPEATEQCGRIIDIVDDCERWIRSVLMANRPVEATFSQTVFRPLIERVVETSRPFAERRRVRLETEIEELPAGRVDAQLFEQALAVLIGNAIDASPDGKVVRIEARLVSEPDDEVFIDVIDFGAGVPDEMRSRIFDNHFSTKPTGTGIGLHFARRIARAHDGDLTLVGGSGTGRTCFRFRVPANGKGKGDSWPTS